ncbi:AAA family ATPase [Bacillus piscicola]|uniref:AAA family ATPase n=1 Tax=Bacillus piscicola TaxID=1632684 RepID=UPI001F08A301|nr:AAA family ATPase [Bacillus piscicola]
MYFSAKAFNEFYPQLSTQREGKTNLERTSSLAYFLAIDQLQKMNESETIDVHKDSPLKRQFVEKVSELLVLGDQGTQEMQANCLGIINLESGDKIKTKVGKNFLSTQVNRATISGETEYPTRPNNSALLTLGLDTENGKTGIAKHSNWPDNLMKFINFRICGDNAFPLIVFLLRKRYFEENNILREALETELLKIFSADVTSFLISNATIPELDSKYFSETPWEMSDLDDDLFRNREQTDQTGDNGHHGAAETYPSLNISQDIPRNKIIYGAPGTGKSYSLNKEVETFFMDRRLIERITFYPSYSYNQFIGSYKPVPLYVKSEEAVYNTDKRTEMEQQVKPIIDYQFVPGPFISTLVKAIKNPYTSFVLIIEEINRANAASVFGDAFQLLDRDEDGQSEYSIVFNPDVMNFLRSVDIIEDEVKIPSNFFIWATMNSADQGVSPLDSAFKRRWSFEYIPLDENQDIVKDILIELPFMEGEKVSWNKLRATINEHIKDFVPEDKLLGPFFLRPHELKNREIFKNKLLLYLRDDVLRHNYNKLFLQKNFSDIVKDYDNKRNIFVFSEEELRSDA